MKKKRKNNIKAEALRELKSSEIPNMYVQHNEMFEFF